jgi:hypothetical protein
MPSRKLTTHSFTNEASRSRPIASISPGTQTKVIGALIRLDGRSSDSADDEELTYSWVFLETPLGSTVSALEAVEEDGSVATFVPDVTGEYIVGLTVSTAYRTSEQVSAEVGVQSILAPYTLRTTPDGSMMFNVLSSFWRMVEERQVFSSIWSGYMQAVGADLLRLFQVDFAKSIKTIQPLFQRRWLLYSPSLTLNSAKHSGIFGRHQSGNGAFTPAGSVAGVGTIISARELLLFDGAPTSGAVGEELTVYTSGGSPGNLGSYLVNRINADSSGYVVSATTPFPEPTAEVLAEGTDLVTLSADAEVFVSDIAEDFSAKGVVIGDVFRIGEGTGAGYYRILGVGTADGLPNERTLLLDVAPTVSKSGRSYTIFKVLRVFAKRTPAAGTNLVFIPADDADLTKFSTADLTGTGTAKNVFELEVEARHVFPALEGQRITVTSGVDGGRAFTVAGVNEAKTGYLLSSALGATTFPAAVTYEIPVVSDISNRLLILGDRAFEIVSASLDTSGTSAVNGGDGDVWVITLAESTAPTGLEKQPWRIAATLRSTEFDDFEELGVTEGDLLLLSVTRADSGQAGKLPCYVLGAAGNKVAFDFGAGAPVAGVNGSFSNAELLELSQALDIPRVVVDPEDSDSLLITLTAGEIEALIGSKEFEAEYHNLPLGSGAVVDLSGYSVEVRAVELIRNRRVPVDSSVASIPSLFEYIDEPEYGEDKDTGAILLVGRDSSLTELDREPLELLENRDFSVSSETSIQGVLQTTKGSGLFTIQGGDLVDRDVRVGDELELTSGFDQGVFFIKEVRDSETLRATGQGGEVPIATAEGVQFRIRKRSEGTFLRFVDGMFTPESPAPVHLWAQTTLFDNAEYIEDNFGVLVGISKAQLDEFGSSQISYRGAVTALMYAWANGPSLRNVATGCHVLTGLPVTEVAGSIQQLDPEYDTAKGIGRILIEDLDSDGQGTGLLRIYYYAATADADALEDFAGIATNPATGLPYTLGDTVPPFQTLSKSLLVSDYISKPRWWSLGERHELQKFHTWQVELDAHQIDSRDMPLIADFCMGIRPVYTFPHLVLVLYLSVDVTVEDDFLMEQTLLLADSPALSLESTNMLDSYNGSSLAQRLLDHGSLSTRTLFEGRDLVTTAASGTVISARGGFAASLDEDPLDHALDEPVGLVDVNEWFEEPLYFRGSDLVAAGDILFIRTGPNRGRYSITSVADDSTLVIAALADWPPTTRPAADLEAQTGQVFQIQRQDTAVISSGSATVESYDSGADMTVIEAALASHRWDRVAVGDTLVISDGADYGTHRILQVGKLDDTYTPGGPESPDEHLESLENHLIIEGELTESAAFAYVVRRDGLRSNPLVSREDGRTATGSAVFTADDAGLLLEGLRYGDALVVDAGVDSGSYKIVEVQADDSILLDREFTLTQSTLSYSILRESLFEQDGRRDHDWEQESLMALDEVEATIVEPTTSFGSYADLVLSGATATSATNLEAAGVTADMILEVELAAGSTGAYRLDSVVGAVVTALNEFTEDEGPITGEFLELDDAWEVLNDSVTLTGTSNLEFGPMLSTEFPDDPATATFNTASPTTLTGIGSTFLSTFQNGDVVRMEGDTELEWARILEIVSDTEITLDRDYTGPNSTGRVERGTYGGMVRQGDFFDFAEGVFVVKSVQAATMTLTSSTGVSPVANYTGKVTRKLGA